MTKEFMSDNGKRHADVFRCVDGTFLIETRVYENQGCTKKNYYCETEQEALTFAERFVRRS